MGTRPPFYCCSAYLRFVCSSSSRSQSFRFTRQRCCWCHSTFFRICRSSEFLQEFGVLGTYFIRNWLTWQHFTLKLQAEAIVHPDPLTTDSGCDLEVVDRLILVFFGVLVQFPCLSAGCLCPRCTSLIKWTCGLISTLFAASCRVLFGGFHTADRQPHGDSSSTRYLSPSYQVFVPFGVLTACIVK